MKGIGMIRPCLRGMVCRSIKFLNWCEQHSLYRLNICYGNSDRIEIRLPHFVFAEEDTGFKKTHCPQGFVIAYERWLWWFSSSDTSLILVNIEHAKTSHVLSVAVERTILVASLSIYRICGSHLRSGGELVSKQRFSRWNHIESTITHQDWGRISSVMMKRS